MGVYPVDASKGRGSSEKASVLSAFDYRRLGLPGFCGCGWHFGDAWQGFLERREVLLAT